MKATGTTALKRTTVVLVIIVAACAGGLGGLALHAGELPHGINLRYPPSSVSVVEFAGAYRSKTKIEIVRDVDGDGKDDLMFLAAAQPGPNGSAPGAEIRILFGFAKAAGHTNLNELRRCVIEIDYQGLAEDDRSYNGVGDVDGDGYGDLAVGLPFLDTSAGGERSGLVVIIHGTPNWPERVSLRTLVEKGNVGDLRCTLFVGAAHDRVGREIADVGDLNGDGRDEIAITCWGGEGAVNRLPGAGKTYVLYGGFKVDGGVLDLATVGTALPGFVIRGAYGDDGALHIEGDAFGVSPCEAGDLNGDGYGDMAVAATKATRPGNAAKTGMVYVVFGGPGLPAEIALEDPQTPEGLFTAIRPPRDFEAGGGTGAFGWSVAGAGDIDGDGLDDLLIGAPGTNEEGFVFLVYGREAWPSVTRVESLEVSSFSLSPPLFGCFQWRNRLGHVVSGLGDWNLDGTADFLVTAPHQWGGEVDKEAGAAFIVFGGSVFGGREYLNAAGGEMPRIEIVGSGARKCLGEWAAGGGDLDGDGRKDLVLAAPCRACGPEAERLLYIYWGGDEREELKLHAVEPSVVGYQGGDTVTLWGEGFEGSETVYFGSVEVEEVDFVSSCECRCVVPAFAGPERVDVVVRGSRGEARLKGALSLVPTSPWHNIRFERTELRHGEVDGLFALTGIIAPSTYVRKEIRVLAVGDVTGDGVSDLIIGEPDFGVDRQGRLVILFGRSDFPPVLDVNDLEEKVSFLEGDSPNAVRLGRWVSVLGDLNGDGSEEIAFGAYDPLTGSADTYVSAGRSDWGDVLSIWDEVTEGRSCLAVRNMWGGPIDYIGGAGDLDSDGYGDVFATGKAPGMPDSVSLYYGSPSLSEIFEAPLGVVTYRDYPGFFAYNVAGVGDFNGDARIDLVAATQPDRTDEEVLFLLGARHGFREKGLDVADLDSAGRVLSVTEKDRQPISRIGEHVGGGGDFNGDGLADVLIGDKHGGIDLEGVVHIVFGRENIGPIDLEGSEGGITSIRGAYGDDRIYIANFVGDLNGDGFDDVAVVPNEPLSVPGEFFCRRTMEARAYVVFGSPEPPREIHLRNLNPPYGFQIAAAWREAFFMQAQGGDVNGDGRSDAVFLLGAGGKELAVLTVFGRKSEVSFLRGDVNIDGARDLADAVAALSHLFAGRTLGCADAADCNDDGKLTIADPIFLLSHLFGGGRELPPPFQECGPDPSADDIDCRSFRACW